METLNLITISSFHICLQLFLAQVMILSHLFLKDPCSRLKICSVMGLVAGVTLICQPQLYLLKAKNTNSSRSMIDAMDSVCNQGLSNASFCNNYNTSAIVIKFNWVEISKIAWLADLNFKICYVKIKQTIFELWFLVKLLRMRQRMIFLVTLSVFQL